MKCKILIFGFYTCVISTFISSCSEIKDKTVTHSNTEEYSLRDKKGNITFYSKWRRLRNNKEYPLEESKIEFVEIPNENLSNYYSDELFIEPLEEIHNEISMQNVPHDDENSTFFEFLLKRNAEVLSITSKYLDLLNKNSNNSNEIFSLYMPDITNIIDKYRPLLSPAQGISPDKNMYNRLNTMSINMVKAIGKNTIKIIKPAIEIFKSMIIDNRNKEFESEINFLIEKKTTVDITFDTKRNNHKDCSICLSNFDDGDECKILGCGHILHKKCINTWIKTKKSSTSPATCPLCRAPIIEHADEAEEKLSTLLDELENLINQDETKYTISILIQLYGEKGTILILRSLATP